MVDDAKINFYLAHRGLIEAWAALAEATSEALDHALMTAVQTHVIASDHDLPAPRITRAQQTLVNLDVTTDPQPTVSIEIAWDRQKLLRRAGPWPSLRLVTDPRSGRVWQEMLRGASMGALVNHAMDKTSFGWWVRYGQLAPAQEPIDIDGFSNECIQRFVQAYLDLQHPLREAVTRFSRDVSEL